MGRSSRIAVFVMSSLCSVGLFAGGADLEIVAVEPTARTLTASVNTPVVIHFDRPVLAGSIQPDRVKVFGRWSGAVNGDYVISADGRTLTIEPDRSFSAGENVTVVLSQDIQGTDGSTLRAGGHSFQFWTRSRAATVSFSEIGRLSTRVLPSQPSQAYGGIASDLDGDRWLDITIVNEITADLRVFMNRADGTGMLFDFIQPTFPVGDRASPSEPSDFNGDGTVDVCVANIDADTVSILLGNGDGTFGPQQSIAVGDAPRGIAVLDVDGDGDTDVVNTNSGSGSGALNMTLMINDGNGVFGAPIFFKAGVTGPWALAAADMNEDGILDLVVGARDAQLINILGGRGDGTFELLGSQSAGGQVWMLVCGDVDGDGHEDVAGINSFDNNGAILIGDGTGQLDPPQVYATDPFVLASDLGDFDGDGDLDWMTSSYNGNWRLYENDGTGVFAFAQEFPATSASSCSLALDLDNDRDLDLGLIDEIADELILMQNDGISQPAAPPGVPSGAMATAPLILGKLDPAGVELSFSWDSTTCGGVQDYQILYGGGSQLPLDAGGVFGLSGSRCGIGTSSPFVWSGSPDPSTDPEGWLWFVVVANDTVGNEGSWGTDRDGLERVGPGNNGASNECNVIDKNLSNTCGQ